MEKEIPLKWIQLVDEYFKNGFNGKAAYMKVYNTDNENVAAVEACNILKDPRVRKHMEEVEGGYRDIMRDMKIGKTQLVKKLWELANYEKPKYTNSGELVGKIWDTVSANNAIDKLIKLTGDYAPTNAEAKKKSKASELEGKELNELEAIKARIIQEDEGTK